MFSLLRLFTILCCAHTFRKHYKNNKERRKNLLAVCWRAKRIVVQSQCLACAPSLSHSLILPLWLSAWAMSACRLGVSNSLTLEPAFRHRAPTKLVNIGPASLLASLPVWWTNANPVFCLTPKHACCFPMPTKLTLPLSLSLCRSCSFAPALSHLFDAYSGWLSASHCVRFACVWAVCGMCPLSSVGGRAQISLGGETSNTCVARGRRLWLFSNFVSFISYTNKTTKPDANETEELRCCLSLWSVK